MCSPLARSKKTAEIIWGSRQEPIIPDFDLREIDLYSFQVCYAFLLLFILFIECRNRTLFVEPNRPLLTLLFMHDI